MIAAHEYVRQQTDDFFRLDQDTADFEAGDAFTRLETSDGDVKIIFSRPIFQIKIPARWSTSCWMIWAGNPVNFSVCGSKSMSWNSTGRRKC